MLQVLLRLEIPLAVSLVFFLHRRRLLFFGLCLHVALGRLGLDMYVVLGRPTFLAAIARTTLSLLLMPVILLSLLFMPMLSMPTLVMPRAVFVPLLMGALRPMILGGLAAMGS
jgi:hypothetical protein